MQSRFANRRLSSALLFDMKTGTNFLIALLLLIVPGCGKSSSESGAETPPPKNTKEAASQLHQAFVSASPEVKNNAEAASQALQAADYEKAIPALQAMKARQNLTFEQGLAVHNSMVALEARLIAGVAAGDPNAKRAYDQFKKMKRE